MSEHAYISHHEFEDSQRELTRALQKLELRLETQVAAVKKAKSQEGGSRTDVVDYSLLIKGLEARITGFEEQQFELAVLVSKLGRTVEVLATSVERMAGIE